MDDFDRLLELQLRRKLDAVVAGPVPVRRGRIRPDGLKKIRRGEESPKMVAGIPIELRTEALVLLEHY